MRIVSKRGLAGMSLVLALCLVAALPAAASAATVTLRFNSKTGPALANGTAIKAFSNNLVWHTASGNFECKENELNGTVANNGTAKTGLSISSASYRAAGGSEYCLTTIPNGTGGTLLMKITAANFLWNSEMFSNGTAVLNGTPSLKFNIGFYNGTTQVAACVAEKPSVAETFNFNTALNLAVGASQEFTGTGSGCPSSWALTGSFAVTINSTGGTVFATSP
jgi:hypothetical protein